MAYNQKIMRMKELIEKLTEADIAYYKNDDPIMTDREYDLLFDELAKLETETSLMLSGSPTQKVSGEILESLTPVTHSKPMLSADKTKSVDDLIKFAKGRDVLLSWKLDGLTIVLRYKDGKLEQAITRGAEGIVGEDVTHTVKTFVNVPLTIPEKSEFEVRGEGVVSYKNFNEINLGLDEPYTLPRALASASTRKLNSNESKERRLEFFAFDIVSENNMPSTKTDEFEFMERNGFQTVPHVYLNADSTADIIKAAVERFEPKLYGYPVDGLIMEYDDIAYGKSLGATGHHENRLIALKWKDELYDTKFLGVRLATTRTGMVSITALLEPVTIHGTVVTHASLHNVDIFEKFKFGIGDTVKIYKANMIIPQCDSVEDNVGEEIPIPDKCPICGGETKIIKNNDSEILMCTNDDCKGKLLGKLSHAVSRNALNVDNLSEATLEKFISFGWLDSIKSIYHLSDYKGKMYSLEGFGKKSVDKLLESIEKSRETILDRFIYSLSISMIGKTASKTIAEHFRYNFDEFYHCFSCGYGYFWNLKVDGIGVVASNNIQKFAITYMDKVFELSKEFTFKIPSESNNTQNTLQGKTFVITGSLEKYSNRDELKSVIESYGGKVSGSVSAKTFALINNDIESSSSKNKKAKSLGVQIINEEQFMQLIGE